MHFTPWFTGYFLIKGMIQVLGHSMEKLYWQYPVRNKVSILPSTGFISVTAYLYVSGFSS